MIRHIVRVTISCLVYAGAQIIGPQGPMEEAGEAIDDSIEDAGDAIEDTTN
ncbi:MAG: hypothetical protein ACNA7T_08595 [Haliea sp.]|jgi:hypothetical protein